MPEGSEDVLLEGVAQWHVQVKSRVERRGLFSASEAAGHILAAWGRHASRDDAGSQLVVVLESGVEGETPSNDLDKSLAESLADGSQLLSSLKEKGSELEMDVGWLLSSTVVVGISWDDVITDTVACLDEQLEFATRSPSPCRRPAPCLPRQRVGRQRGLLSTNSGDGSIGLNSSARSRGSQEWSASSRSRPRYSRTSASRWSTEAIRTPRVAGSMRVQRLNPSMSQQDSLCDAATSWRGSLSGLDERSAVVITGPSGVGKSAVLWTIPREQELRGVAWFRVRRLADEDVPALVRLARAYCASPSVPIGFSGRCCGRWRLHGLATFADRSRSSTGHAPRGHSETRRPCGPRRPG